MGKKAYCTRVPGAVCGYIRLFMMVTPDHPSRNPFDFNLLRVDRRLQIDTYSSHAMIVDSAIIVHLRMSYTSARHTFERKEASHQGEFAYH